LNSRSGGLRRSLRRIAGISATLIAALAVGVAPAYASTSGGIALYLSGPLVHGAELSPAGTTETFDSLGGSPTSGGIDCPTVPLAIGALSVAPASTDCLYRIAGIYGGATATTPTPAFGGPGSNYFGTSGNSSAAITFTFPNPVKYVGFWWSGGNLGNVVTFYNGATEIANFDTVDLTNLLGASPPSSWPSGNGSVTSTGGTAYPKGHYFGNPRGYSEYPPLTQAAAVTQDGAAYTEHRGYLNVYLNLFLTGDQTATSVKFSGNGFEFDNVTTSTAAQTPASSLVFVRGLIGRTVQFLPGASDATGSMVAQSSTAAANLSANSFARAGYVFNGWNTAQDGTGTPYGAEASYDFFADETLYAQWVAAPGGGAGGGGSSSDAGAAELPAEPQIALDFRGRAGQPSAGAVVDVSGLSVPAGAVATVSLFAPEVKLFEEVSTGGAFERTVALPAGLAPGSYTVVYQVLLPSGEVLALNVVVEIGDGGVITSVSENIVGSGPAGVPGAMTELSYTGVRSSSLPWWAIITIFGGLMLILYSRRAVKMAEAFDARLDENGHRTPWEILSTPIRVPGIDYSPGALDAAGSSQSLGEAVKGLDVALSLIIASQIARLRTHA
jgi:hypothetical protein